MKLACTVWLDQKLTTAYRLGQICTIKFEVDSNKKLKKRVVALMYKVFIIGTKNLYSQRLLSLICTTIALVVCKLKMMHVVDYDQSDFFCSDSTNLIANNYRTIFTFDMVIVMIYTLANIT